MLESLRNFLSDLSGDAKRQEAFAEDDYRLAAAALLVHVCTVDGDISAAERTRLHDVLKHRFDLDEAGTARLIDAAIAATTRPSTFITSLISSIARSTRMDAGAWSK